MYKITTALIDSYHSYLIDEEKAPSTVSKYVRDVQAFVGWLKTRDLDKSAVLAYKSYLIESYAPVSVNAAISSLNSFFTFCEWSGLRMKNLKIQRKIFASQEKELTKPEYDRLLRAAVEKKDRRLFCLMQTICSTGIRVSELRFITVEALSRGRAEIRCKGKYRTVFVPAALCKLLKQYLKDTKIKKGPVFQTKSGKPMDRSNIWREMKNLCRVAGVSGKKVFPHNLRHLFARTYYNQQKDVVRLADILGHSSVNTTRIYTMESGEVHRRQIERMGLIQIGCTP